MSEACGFLRKKPEGEQNQDRVDDCIGEKRPKSHGLPPELRY